MKANSMMQYGLGVLFLLSSVPADAVAVVIDNFHNGDVDQTKMLNTATTWTVSVTGTAANIIGTTRDVIWERPADTASYDELTIGYPGDNLMLSHAGTHNSQLTLVWDGDTDATAVDHTGLGGADLTGVGGLGNPGAALGFYTTIGSIDREVTLGFTVYTDNANYSVYDYTFDSPVTDFLIPFSSFNISGGSGTAWHDVGAIVMMVTGLDSFDFSMDFLETRPEPTDTDPTHSVPEPTLITLLGAGLFGIGISRRRAKR